MALSKQESRPPDAPLPQFDPTAHLPSRELPREGIGLDTAYELISSDLLLDGQARLNLATFVTTWMPSSAGRVNEGRAPLGGVSEPGTYAS